MNEEELRRARDRRDHEREAEYARLGHEEYWRRRTGGSSSSSSSSGGAGGGGGCMLLAMLIPVAWVLARMA